MENQQVAGNSAHSEHPQTGPLVTVKVDGNDKTIHRGDYVVSDFKEKVGVDPALELAEVVNGQLQALSDTSRVIIKGGEVFFSRVRKGGSS